MHLLSGDFMQYLTGHYFEAFFWAIFVGFVYTSTGAAGGVLAVFGFITLLHSPVNSTKVMSLILVIVSALVAIPTYFKQDRIKTIKKVLIYAALSMAAGGVLGGVLGPWLSKTYLYRLKSFKYYFGYMIFIVALLMIYKTVRETLKARKAHKEAAALKGDTGGTAVADTSAIGKFSIRRMEFTVSNIKYSFSPIALFVAGFCIIVVATIFGVGGGFLVSPFLVDIVGFPVFLAAGTSVLAVLFSATVASVAYMRMHIGVIVPLLSTEVGGIAVGSFLGPKIGTRINDKWLKYMLVGVLFFIGVLYIFKP